MFCFSQQGIIWSDLVYRCNGKRKLKSAILCRGVCRIRESYLLVYHQYGIVALCNVNIIQYEAQKLMALLPQIMLAFPIKYLIILFYRGFEYC